MADTEDGAPIFEIGCRELPSSGSLRLRSSRVDNDTQTGLTLYLQYHSQICLNTTDARINCCTIYWVVNYDCICLRYCAILSNIALAALKHHTLYLIRALADCIKVDRFW